MKFLYYRIVLALFIIFTFTSCSKKDTKNDIIKFYTVKKGDIESVIKVTGTIVPKTGAEIKVGSRVSGKVEKLFVKVGDYVKQDDMIAIIEHDDLDFKVKKLKSTELYLQNELNSVKNEYPIKINAKKSYIESLEVKRDFLTKEYNRNKELFESDMISLQSLENIDKELQYLIKTLEYEKSNLLTLQKEFEDKILSYKFKIQEAHNDARVAEINYKFAFIKAPISGIISTVSTQEGETVAASLSSPVFVNIIDLEKLQVSAYIDETDIGKVKVGQNIKFITESFSDTIFNGKVVSVYPKAEITNNVVTYKIEATIDNFDKSKIKPDMTVYMDVIIETKNSVLLVPLKSVKLINGQNFVFLKKGSEKFEKRAVQLGVVNNGMVEILNGIKDGDEIVMEGFKSVSGI